MPLQTTLDGNPPASEADLTALAIWAPSPLPAEYLAVLRMWDGGQASRTSPPTYLRFWPVRTVIDYNDGYQIQDWVPGLIGFGDDGGSTFVSFDTRSGPPYPVVAVPFTPMEFSAVKVLATNFVEFVGQLVPES